MKLVISPRAHADLDEIWFYIAEHSLDAADNVVGDIRGTATLLTDQPAMGVARPDLQPGLRCLAISG